MGDIRATVQVIKKSILKLNFKLKNYYFLIKIYLEYLAHSAREYVWTITFHKVCLTFHRLTPILSIIKYLS